MQSATPSRNVPATVALVVIAVAAVSGVPFLARIEPEADAALAARTARPGWAGAYEPSWSVVASEPLDQAFMSASRNDGVGDAAPRELMPQPAWIAEHVFVVTAAGPATAGPALAWSGFPAMGLSLGCVRVVKAIPSDDAVGAFAAAAAVLDGGPVFLSGVSIDVTRLDFDVNGVLVTTMQVDCATL